MVKVDFESSSPIARSSLRASSIFLLELRVLSFVGMLTAKRQKLKVSVVGANRIGKSSLIYSYLNNDKGEDENAQDSVVEVNMDEYLVTLTLADPVPKADAIERLRPYPYF